MLLEHGARRGRAEKGSLSAVLELEPISTELDLVLLNFKALFLIHEGTKRLNASSFYGWYGSRGVCSIRIDFPNLIKSPNSECSFSFEFFNVTHQYENGLHSRVVTLTNNKRISDMR